MSFLKSKKKLVLLSICLVLFLYLKLYKFDRYFIISKNDKNCVTYFMDGNSVYIMPYKYWGLNNPTSNYIKFDRSNYSQEMNILTFYNTEKYPFIFEYENGDLIENKLNKNYYYFKRKEIFNDPYLKEIKFGDNEKKVEITSSYIRNNNPFWYLINKIF
ncbi:hypothetical protein [Flavobacterium sp.]|uniref:hypothetical protein n=1 Tax=Flavobacterium sp. TaxID=239 RepID=UPI003D6C5D15